jgi:hypothetical protein
MENREIRNYDLNGIKDELSKHFRLLDTDILVIENTCDEMEKVAKVDRETYGCCTNDYAHNAALIYLNGEMREMKIPYDDNLIAGWMYTFVHELLHIIMYPLSTHAYDMARYAKNDVAQEIAKEDVERHEERVVNSLTKTVMNLMGSDGIDALLQRHRKGGSNGKTKTGK